MDKKVEAVASVYMNYLKKLKPDKNTSGFFSGNCFNSFKQSNILFP